MTMLQCEIRNLNGGIQTVNVPRAAKVWKLWNVLEEIIGVPEYEQQLVCGSVHLRSEMALSDLLPTPDSCRLQLTLVRTPTPKCFGIASTKQIWNAFLSLSDDGGGTISVGHVNQLMQYAGMHRSSAQFKASDSAHKKLTFSDLLSLMAAWKPVEPSPVSVRDLEHELELLDTENTGFVSRRDFTRTTLRVFAQDDSDGEDDSDSDGSESDDGDDLEGSSGDERVEWRRELQEIFAETDDDFLW
eukprot:TRINITY_DN5120_c0_g2_i3.p1 TRINITY_DN5120_c0_g2~~TRINITY_DN5120_c0_g2_i3.p1  ORF type:complete len:244 (+),score=56.39 TRINITY_DN5120_c0_g2_i3:79-810(+)